MLIFVSLALSQTAVYIAGYCCNTGLVHRTVCLFTVHPSFHWYSLRLPMEGCPG